VRFGICYAGVPLRRKEDATWKRLSVTERSACNGRVARQKSAKSLRVVLILLLLKVQQDNKIISKQRKSDFGGRGVALQMHENPSNLGLVNN